MALTFGTSNPARSGEISRQVKAGKLRKLATKLYTDDLKSDPEEIVRRNRLEIIAHFYPDAVISHRSALEGARVSPAGKLNLTVPGKAAPVRKLPGLEIRLWQGPGRQTEDIVTPVGGSLTVCNACSARAVLENLQLARARSSEEAKTFSQEELEKWFERQIRIYGESWLDEIEENADPIADRLGWNKEKERLAGLLAAIRGKPSPIRLATNLALSRAKGRPYDPDRVALFSDLHVRLAQESFAKLPPMPSAEIENRAFWEAYFSNFIEGTRFSVEEARELVSETGASEELAKTRPEDAHDVRETYRLIVDPNISGDVAQNLPDYIDLLKRRHSRMMASRPSVEPGVFKTRRNEVGSRVFVYPELVQETLSRGWSASRTLPNAIARAFYLLFVVAEVHPFKDGNGRISRLGMNAALENDGQARLVIPTSLRNDYLTVLEALTTNQNPEPYVAFAHKLIDINSRIPFQSFEATHAHFRKTGALDEPTSSQLTFPPQI